MTVWNNPLAINSNWNEYNEWIYDDPNILYDSPLISYDSRNINSRTETTVMLAENGNEMWQEDGDTILVEIWSGFRKIASKINTIWQ